MITYSGGGGANTSYVPTSGEPFSGGGGGDILDFDAEDSFEIKGRGTVYAGRCPIDDGEKMTGQVVRIRGSLYRVTAVERGAFYPRLGEPIGLLVEPI